MPSADSVDGSSFDESAHRECHARRVRTTVDEFNAHFAPENTPCRVEIVRCEFSNRFTRRPE
jgi:hypothetical protein